MGPRKNDSTVINEDTQFSFKAGHFYAIISTVIMAVVTPVIMWFQLGEKIDKSALEQTKALWRTIELIQIDVRYQGQAVWAEPKNDYLRSQKNEEVQRKFAEFAAEEKLVMREGADQPFKFNLEN